MYLYLHIQLNRSEWYNMKKKTTIQLIIYLLF